MFECAYCIKMCVCACARQCVSLSVTFHDTTVRGLIRITNTSNRRTEDAKDTPTAVSALGPDHTPRTYLLHLLLARVECHNLGETDQAGSSTHKACASGTEMCAVFDVKLPGGCFVTEARTHRKTRHITL